MCGRVLWCGRSRVRLTRVDCEVCGAAFLCLWCWLCDPAGRVAGLDCARARVLLFGCGVLGSAYVVFLVIYYACFMLVGIVIPPV